MQLISSPKKWYFWTASVWNAFLWNFKESILKRAVYTLFECTIESLESLVLPKINVLCLTTLSRDLASVAFCCIPLICHLPRRVAACLGIWKGVWFYFAPRVFKGLDYPSLSRGGGRLRWFIHQFFYFYLFIYLNLYWIDWNPNDPLFWLKFWPSLGGQTTPETKGKQVPGTYILPILIVLMAEILHQLRLVVYPIIYDVFYTFEVLSRMYEPSTAS